MPIINASTTSGLVFTGDQTGVLQLQNNGVTLPALTVAPAFAAYATSGTVTAGNNNTKILFQVERYDTNNNFASSRFTPTVAGYYQFNAYVYWGAAMTVRNVIYVNKNGTFAEAECNGADFSNASNWSSTISTMMYANGTTDYFEVWVYQQTGSSYTTGTTSWFTGCLVRGT